MLNLAHCFAGNGLPLHTHLYALVPDTIFVLETIYHRNMCHLDSYTNIAAALGKGSCSAQPHNETGWGPMGSTHASW